MHHSVVDRAQQRVDRPAVGALDRVGQGEEAAVEQSGGVGQQQRAGHGGQYGAPPCGRSPDSKSSRPPRARRSAPPTGTRSRRTTSTRSPTSPATTSGSTSTSSARKDTPFGGTIAHGYYTLCLAPCPQRPDLQLEGFAFALNYGLNRVRFPAPLPVGARCARAPKLKAVDRHPRRRAGHARAHLRARGRRQAGVRGRDARARLRGLEPRIGTARRRRRTRRGRCPGAVEREAVAAAARVDAADRRPRAAARALDRRRATPRGRHVAAQHAATAPRRREGERAAGRPSRRPRRRSGAGFGAVTALIEVKYAQVSNRPSRARSVAPRSRVRPARADDVGLDDPRRHAARSPGCP